MPTKEKLYRVQIKHKRTGFGTYLTIWAEDAMAAYEKVNCLFGPRGEYMLDAVNYQLENGRQLERDAE